MCIYLNSSDNLGKNKKPKIEQIRHQYYITGHTFIQPDSGMAVFERRLAKFGRAIWCMDDWRSFYKTLPENIVAKELPEKIDQFSTGYIN